MLCLQGVHVLFCAFIGTEYTDAVEGPVYVNADNADILIEWYLKNGNLIQFITIITITHTDCHIKPCNSHPIHLHIFYALSFLGTDLFTLRVPMNMCN